MLPDVGFPLIVAFSVLINLFLLIPPILALLLFESFPDVGSFAPNFHHALHDLRVVSLAESP